MHNSKYEYRLCGVKVPLRWYRRLGRFVPEPLRDVRSVPDWAGQKEGWTP